MAASADLAIYQGDDYSAVVTVTSNGTPPATVLAGYTAQAQIRTAVADVSPAVVVQITTTVASPNITLSIPHTITKTLVAQYVWDLQLTYQDGTITTILNGNVNITQEVTRP